MRALDIPYIVQLIGAGFMHYLNKLLQTSESGFTCVRGLMIAAAVSLVVIPVVFSGLAVVLGLMAVVMVSMLVIPVLYINSHQ